MVDERQIYDLRMKKEGKKQDKGKRDIKGFS
jgi:hypothetical protein